MEVALMGRQSSLAKPDLFPVRRMGRSRTGGFEPAVVRLKKRPVSVGLKAVRSAMVAEERESAPISKNSTGPVRLFVGLPVDSVSDCNAVSHVKAIAAGLKALKLLGADGVELPVWWSIAQPESPDRFDWTGYRAVAQMVRAAGLKLRISLHLHGSKKNPAIGMPKWVNRVAEKNPDVLFADRAGRRRDECLSFAVDELPVLDGKSPVEVFEEFFVGFRDAFSDLIGSTITDISVGLGPDGELRYPSFPPNSKTKPFTGVGEFQCYDKYMLANLKTHAEQSGNPYWGLSGPHDVPEYNQSPDSTTFFKDNGGSWESPYGQFFLSWYSNQLLSHGDRILSMASKVFSTLPLDLSARVPLVHWWQNTRSHPAELTAGYFNCEGRDGYASVAEIFAKYSCQMVVPGMDLAEKDQPGGLLSQILKACQRHGVKVSGENSSVGRSGFATIKENILAVDSFTYQRMGADFFSPEHWPLFTEFVRGLATQELDSDDLAGKEGMSMPMSMPVGKVTSNDREMQAV